MAKIDHRTVIMNALVGIKAIDEGHCTRLSVDHTADVELASLGIDSMAVIDLCMAIEESIGREVTIEELVENASLNKLSKHLSKT